MTDARDIVERLRAATYTRERWVEPVGNVDEPCDADDLGAVECLRNPDGPEAADTIASLRKQLEDAREALNKADSALRGGHAIIVNQLPHAPWLRTMDEAIEAISALNGKS